jgi:hypothetical protein
MVEEAAKYPIPLAKARAAIWPFRDIRGQAMGVLLDSGQISLQDLGFAAERAYNEQVRLAARTLMMHQLGQAANEPAQPVGPLNVITSGRRSFAEGRQLQLAMIQGWVSGASIGIMLVYLFQFIQRAMQVTDAERAESSQRMADILRQPNGVPAVIFAVLVIFGLPAFFYFLVMQTLNWLERRFDRYRAGQKGEEAALNVFYHALDGNWHLFRNLELPGRRGGDMDFVLVGASGVWVIEVKTWQGDYRNTGDRWEKRLRNRWLSVWRSPSQQAKRNAARLSEALKTKDITQWIHAAIVWANPKSSVIRNYEAVPVWSLDILGEKLSQLKDKSSMAQPQRDQIIAVLKDLCKPTDEANTAGDTPTA